MNYDDIKNDEGRIDKENEKAVYRDKDGKLHIFSSHCTHERCTLEWNDFGKTWDCPCHAARFTGDGHVEKGPAIEPMKEIE